MGNAAEISLWSICHSPRCNRIKSRHPHAPRGGLRAIMETYGILDVGEIVAGRGISYFGITRLGGFLLPDFFTLAPRPATLPTI